MEMYMRMLILSNPILQFIALWCSLCTGHTSGENHFHQPKTTPTMAPGQRDHTKPESTTTVPDIQIPSLGDILNKTRIRELYTALGKRVGELYSEPAATSSSIFSALPNAAPSPIEKANKNVHNIAFQMDQILNEGQIEQLIEATSNQTRSKRGAMKIATHTTSRWPNGILYYQFQPGLAPAAKTAIQQAIAFYTQTTCIRFQESSTQQPRVLVTGNDPEGGCWSALGRQAGMAQQLLNLDEGCRMMSLAAHELAHALGIYHEQARYDRDSHITADLTNVQPALIHNYAKVGPELMALYNLPYDTGSNMQYDPFAFAINPAKPVMTTKIQNMYYTLGQYYAPSFRDILTLNIHYNCLGICLPSEIKCKNGGYLNPNNCNQCTCPTGWGGQDCSAREVPTIAGCGGMLTATDTANTFTISMPLNNNANQQRRCIYHIKPTTAGMQLVITVTDMSTVCQNGCYTSSSEFKWSTNQQITGARFCCKGEPRSVIISNAPTVPVILFSKRSAASVSFTYSQRNPPAG